MNGAEMMRCVHLLGLLRTRVSPARLFPFCSFFSTSTTASNARSASEERGGDRLAYVVGPDQPPLLEQTVPQHFASVVGRFGDRTAVVSQHQQQTLTYRALDERSNALARGLEAAGVEKGTRVAVSLGNNIEFAALTYACFKIGAILAPLNPAFTPAQIAAALSRLESTHLVIGLETNLPRRQPTSNIPTLQSLITDLSSSALHSTEAPSLQSLILVNNADGRIDPTSVLAGRLFEDVLADGGDGSRTLGERSLDKNDIVNIQFTSGTTSMPKAACLTHRSILNNGFSIGARLGLSEHDVVVCPPPLFHCFGSILGYMATATHGAALVLPSESFAPEPTLAAVQEHRATALYGVPTMFLGQLELLATKPAAFDRTRFARLRTGIAAGSQVPRALMARIHNELGLGGLIICYGMTETSPVSCMTFPSDPVEKRVGTVGRAMPHVTAKVVDPSNPAVTLERNQQGELLVSGYLLMKEYWRDPARTTAATVNDHDGRWMRTGDEALIDDDGFVVITGRLKDVIIRGGENIHPLDVEDCLLQHPLIFEVSAFGVPDPRYGEVVAVSCVLRGDAKIEDDEVRAWVRERMPRHFVPKHVFFTGSLPKTPSGKIQRFKLREDAVRELRLEEA